MFIFMILLLLFIYLRERKGERKRGREILICVCFSCTLYWGPGPQPRHVPWLGIEPARADFTSWLLIHIFLLPLTRYLLLLCYIINYSLAILNWLCLYWTSITYSSKLLCNVFTTKLWTSPPILFTHRVPFITLHY